jgi:hypothetical protein
MVNWRLEPIPFVDAERGMAGTVAAEATDGGVSL